MQNDKNKQKKVTKEKLDNDSEVQSNWNDINISDAFIHFLEMMFNNWKYDPWLNEITTDDMVKELISELEEFQYAETKEHKSEELGDVLWDVFNLIFLFSREYDVPIEKAFQLVVKKMQHRKPYVFEKRFVSLEEAKRIWRKAKEMEKEGKVNFHQLDSEQ